MDVASKADEKRKRKDGRHETLSKDSHKPSGKGIKTRTQKSSTTKKVSIHNVDCNNF